MAEEPKENVFPESFAASVSASAVVSGMGLPPAAAALALGGRDGGLEGGAKALQSCRAEELHDLDRNSMGSLGLSGRVTPLARVFSDHLVSMIPAGVH